MAKQTDSEQQAVLNQQVQAKLVKQTEALQKDNARLRMVLDNVPGGIAILRLRQGKLQTVSVNKQLAADLSFPPGELAVSGVEELMQYIHPEERGWAGQALREFLQGGSDASVVCRLCNAQTKLYRWTRVKGRLVQLSRNNTVAYLTLTNVDDMKQAEEALRESRHIYEATTSAAKLVMWEYDIPRHRVIRAANATSKEEFERFQLPAVIENVPDSVLARIDDADVESFKALYRKVAAGKNATGDFWYKARPGQETRCERISYTVVKDARGIPVKAYAIGQNITAEKKVAERYAREMENLRQYQSVNLLAKSHCNLTANTVLEHDVFSDKGFRLDQEVSSYDAGVNAYVAHMVQPSDQSAVLAFMNRENLIRRYQQGEMYSVLKFHCCQSGNAPFWVVMEIHTFMMPVTGDLECFTYISDFTAQAMEEQIITKLHILGYDELGMISAKTDFWRCYRLSGKVKDNVWESTGDYADEVERYLREDVVPAEQERVRRGISRQTIVAALEKSPVYTFTNTTKSQDGSLQQKMFKMTYLDDTKESIFYCMSDITKELAHERKQLDKMAAAKLEADKANEAKSAFLSSMSHDLRTPLNGIIGFTHLALKEVNKAQKQDYLQKVDSSAQLLLALVNDTLDLSRIDSGKLTLDLEAVDGVGVGRDVVVALRPSAELKHIDLTVDLSHWSAQPVWTDKLKLQKILLNLLSNAIKYTPEGGKVKLTVALANNQKTGRIIVEDNGIGMSQEFMTRLFEPFSQEKRPEAGNVLGTGLGLSIVKHIVDLMEGTIKVESKINQGSKFTVDLPLHIVSAVTAKAAQKQKNSSLATLQGKHILLCEDNYLNAEIATVLLKEKGLLVDVAVNGKLGVEKFQASQPGTYAAILMDIRMPVLDGYGATAAIRKLPRSDAALIPIIAMTADAFEEDIAHFQAAGMAGYVLKPFTADRLLSELSRNIK